MPDPISAALRFGYEIVLLYGVIAVLFVAVVAKDGHGSTFRYAIDTIGPHGPPVAAAVLAQVRRGIPLDIVVTLVGLYILFGL